MLSQSKTISGSLGNCFLCSTRIHVCACARVYVPMCRVSQNDAVERCHHTDTIRCTHTHTYSVHKYTQTHFKHHRSGTAIFVMICVNRSALVFWLVTSFLLLFGVAIRFYGFFLLLHNIFPPCVQQHKNTHAHTALFIVNHPFCTSGSIQFKLNFTLPCIYTHTVCIRAN